MYFKPTEILLMNFWHYFSMHSDITAYIVSIPLNVHFFKTTLTIYRNNAYSFRKNLFLTDFKNTEKKKICLLHLERIHPEK